MIRPFALQLVLISLLASAQGGTRSSVYLSEGFDGLSLPAGWSQTRIAGSQATWSFVGQGTNPIVFPYRGAGQARFNSFTAPAGEQARLISRSLNLSAATDPFLSFFMYHDDEYLSSLDSLYVEVTTGDSIAGPWTQLAGIRRPRLLNGWTQEVITLYPYRGATRLFVGFRGLSKYGNNLYLDEVRIADSTFRDIGPIALRGQTPFIAPASAPHDSRTIFTEEKQREATSQEILAAYAGAPLNLKIVLRNYGTSPEASYTIGWRVNAQAQSPVSGPALPPRTGTDSATLVWNTLVAGTHTVTAWTSLAADSNKTNDTIRIQLVVLDTATVYFESFNGSGFPPTGWATINRDGGALAPWFRGGDTSAFVALEGSGFAANNFQRSNNRYLDDYLITPPIAGVNSPGRADSVIFWVQSKLNAPPFANFPDSLMVLVSTSGTDTSNFTTLLEYFAVPKGTWTRKAYTLQGRVPANSTIRIAFRYLLRDVGATSGSGDFIGLDAVQVVRKLPAGTHAEDPIPSATVLVQNYPNPFNPNTTILFQIGDGGEVKRGTLPHVTLRVYDLLGRNIATLVDEAKQPGVYNLTWNASGWPSGVYFYRLDVGTYSAVKRMLLIK